MIGTEGAQAGIALSLLAAIDPGDEVILGDPGYFHLPSAVHRRRRRARVRAVGRDSGFRIDPDAVAAAVTPRTRAICLVDPSTPTAPCRARRAGGAGHAGRAPRPAAHPRRHPWPARDRPRQRVRSRCRRIGLTERAVADVLGLALLGPGQRAYRLPRRPPRPDARLPAAKAAITRLNTDYSGQHGALAALRDRDYLPRAERAIRAQPRRTSRTARRRARRARWRCARAAAWPARSSLDTGASAQELMVALFARRIAVYPGDGLGETGAGRPRSA